MITGREDWIIKLGPFTRVNTAENRNESREGAMQKIMDDSEKIMERAKVLIPDLMKDASCAEGEEPEIKEEPAKPQIYSYRITEKKWFSIATSGVFGIKLTCKS